MRFILIALFVSFSLGSMSQNVIKGRIVSDEGPLIGVSILIDGTSVGTLTDIEGNFKLEHELMESELLLKFSYTGFIREKMLIENKKLVDLGDVSMYLLKSKEGRKLKKAAKKAK